MKQTIPDEDKLEFRRTMYGPKKVKSRGVLSNQKYDKGGSLSKGKLLNDKEIKSAVGALQRRFQS